MSPPGGSGVLPVIPAASRTIEFTQRECPSTAFSITGRSGTIRSRWILSGPWGGKPSCTASPNKGVPVLRAYVRSCQQIQGSDAAGAAVEIISQHR